MALVSIAWVVICAFPVSAVLFLIGYWMLPRAATRWRRAALIGLGLSLTLLALFTVMLILNPK